jgi:elongation factor P
MLEYNEIVERKYIIFNGDPYEVLTSHVFRKQQRKPVNATKLKNLFTGKVTEYSFHQNEKAEEAIIDKRDVKFLYTNKGELWFCEANDPSKRFSMTEEFLGPQAKYIKANTIISLLSFAERPIGLKFPITVDLKVTEAAPAVRGDTVTGGSKNVTLETGATINVPMFVNEGDVIRINTETAEYRERVTK